MQSGQHNTTHAQQRTPGHWVGLRSDYVKLLQSFGIFRQQPSVTPTFTPAQINCDMARSKNRVPIYQTQQDSGLRFDHHGIAVKLRLTLNLNFSMCGLSPVQLLWSNREKKKKRVKV